MTGFMARAGRYRHTLVVVALGTAFALAGVGMSVTPAQADDASVVSDQSTYIPGDPITVSWEGAPGNALDWIGFFPAEVTDPDGNPPSTTWAYLDGGTGEDAATSGALTWDEVSAPARGVWPLPSGDYTVFLLADDGYEIVATTDIAIEGQPDLPENPPEDTWPANPGDSELSSNARDLRVMTLNMWLGGEEIDFDAIVEAVESAEADVVGLQENNGNAARLADELGWDGVVDSGGSEAIISRYPLTQPATTDNYVWVTFEDGSRTAFSNVHLRAYPYAPYDLRDGASVGEVLLNEEYHLHEMASRRQTLPALATAGIPVVLTGDFNVPSHLDWTSAAAESRQAEGEDFVQPVGWPLSIALAEDGFRDTFRTARPDPVATPGYTWTPGYPPPEMPEDEVHDRIDKIYAHGPIETTASEIVGEDHPISDIVVEPWGTDHRAVVSHLRVAPPVSLSSARERAAGATVPVRLTVAADHVGDVDARDLDIEVTRPDGQEADFDLRAPSSTRALIQVRTDRDHPGTYTISVTDNNDFDVAEQVVGTFAPGQGHR